MIFLSIVLMPKHRLKQLLKMVFVRWKKVEIIIRKKKFLLAVSVGKIRETH